MMYIYTCGRRDAVSLAGDACLAAPHRGRAICTGADQPRLPRHPTHGEDAEAVRDSVAAQDLQRDDEWIRHEVVVHARVEDLDGPIVGRRREEGIGRVER